MNKIYNSSVATPLFSRIECSVGIILNFRVSYHWGVDMRQNLSIYLSLLLLHRRTIHYYYQLRFVINLFIYFYPLTLTCSIHLFILHFISSIWLGYFIRFVALFIRPRLVLFYLVLSYPIDFLFILIYLPTYYLSISPFHFIASPSAYLFFFYGKKIFIRNGCSSGAIISRVKLSADASKLVRDRSTYSLSEESRFVHWKSLRLSTIEDQGPKWRTATFNGWNTKNVVQWYKGREVFGKWRPRGLTQPGCDACLYTRP